MSTLEKVKKVVVDQLSVDEALVTPEASFTADLGAYHTLLNKLLESINLKGKYIPFNSYNKAIQNTILSTNSNPKIIVGVLFDESLIKTLDFLSTPIYKDYLVIVVNKAKVPSSFKPVKKNIKETISLLNKTNKLVKIKGINFKETNNLVFDMTENIYEAMDKVYNGSWLLTTWATLSNYLEKNKSKPIISKLSIMQYKNNTVDYFIAINKNSSQIYSNKIDETTFVIDKLNSELQEMQKSGELLNSL